MTCVAIIAKGGCRLSVVAGFCLKREICGTCRCLGQMAIAITYR